MSISAMKQALEALERGRSQIIGALVQQDQDEAITALRQAIAEAEKQEPVAWREVVGKTTHYYDYNEEGRGEPLYLHREWVGLTDEEIGGLTVFDGLHDVEVPILADFVRAIEAKLKEKNT